MVRKTTIATRYDETHRAALFDARAVYEREYYILTGGDIDWMAAHPMADFGLWCEWSGVEEIEDLPEVMRQYGEWQKALELTESLFKEAGCKSV